jgi:hypothetical protein
MAKKRKSTTTRKRRSTARTAITVYSKAPPMRTRSAAPIVVTRSAPRRRSGGGGGGGGGGVHHGARVRKAVAIGGVILGYASRNVEAYKKVPQVMGSRLVTIALAGHLIADKYRGGYIDHIATAATAIAAFNVGKAGSLSGAGALEGDDTGDW